MAWTQTDIDTLKAEIAGYAGAKRIKFGEREIELQSIDQMRNLLGEMQRDVAKSAHTPTSRMLVSNKGV